MGQKENLAEITMYVYILLSVVNSEDDRYHSLDEHLALASI